MGARVRSRQGCGVRHALRQERYPHGLDGAEVEGFAAELQAAGIVVAGCGAMDVALGVSADLTPYSARARTKRGRIALEIAAHMADPGARLGRLRWPWKCLRTADEPNIPDISGPAGNWAAFPLTLSEEEARAERLESPLQVEEERGSVVRVAARQGLRPPQDRR